MNKIGVGVFVVIMLILGVGLCLWLVSGSGATSIPYWVRTMLECHHMKALGTSMTRGDVDEDQADEPRGYKEATLRCIDA